MLEIEVRILEIDRPTVEDRLISMGANKIFDGELYAVLYDKADGSISSAKNVMRLRREGETTYLVYKRYMWRDFTLGRLEYQVEVSDFETAENILKGLGLTEIRRTEKHRTSYKMDDTRFEFDRYYGKFGFIPEFLEIEAQDAAVVYAHAQQLGFERKDCVSWTFEELSDYYLRHQSQNLK